MQIHGSNSGSNRSGGGPHSGSRNGSTNLGSSTNATSSLHRFSVDALAGTGSSSSNQKSSHHNLNITSDEDGSLTSWDDDVPVDDVDDEDDDVGPLSPTAVSTTSDSSRGGNSPTINRSSNSK